MLTPELVLLFWLSILGVLSPFILYGVLINKRGKRKCGKSK